ncbi:MAG: glycosyl hydrolase family 18 protein [Candidatus Fermentibacteria bacterium]|nr:glycosyl hydrolase family 18 protein [Candidatus Fermentibacteria bacterium]
MIITIMVLSLLAGFIVSNEEIIEYPSVHYQAVQDNLIDVDSHRELVVVDNSGDSELYGTVFGFLPFWVNQAWLHYDLISVLAVFSVDMGAGGTITNAHGFPATFATAMDQAHANGAEVVVTVTNFSGSSIHSILTTGRSTAIATIEDLVNSTVVDGVCIDFENVQAADSDSLVTFMDDLRAALPDAHISICTPVVDWSGAFNYSELAQSCDALMMMCYAFSGSWSAVAGPNAPLVGWGSSPESSSNMAWALCDYIRYAPDVHEKLVVGLPYYGHQWETAGSSTHSPVSSCNTLFYTAMADSADAYGALWDEESLTAWYCFNSAGWNQGWYDDDESLGLKYDMVTMSGIQGIGIWALGYDGERTELWEELEDSFGEPVVNDMITDNLENCFQLHGPSSYWHPYTENGQYHTFFYTGSISSGPDVNWAQWFFQLPDSTASYYLESYIPSTGTASVTYHILHGSEEDSVTVNQSAFSEQWVSLGGPYYSANGLSVTVGDNTGTAGQRIVVDAVRFTQSTGIEQFSDELSGQFTVSASPASSFTVCSLDGGRLQIIDVCGRVVTENNLQPGASWTWNDRAPSGVYFISIDGGGEFSSCRVVLLK